MTEDVPSPERRWNHNTHFHARVLDTVPDGANTALDVETGNGLLARDLHDAGRDVTATDLDADVLRATRSTNADIGNHWQHGDVMTHCPGWWVSRSIIGSRGGAAPRSTPRRRAGHHRTRTPRSNTPRVQSWWAPSTADTRCGGM